VFEVYVGFQDATTEDAA